MSKKIKYNKHVTFRADDKIRNILIKFKEKTGVGFSEMIRSDFLFFDSNFITLLKILEESKENEKKEVSKVFWEEYFKIREPIIEDLDDDERNVSSKF